MKKIQLSAKLEPEKLKLVSKKLKNYLMKSNIIMCAAIAHEVTWSHGAALRKNF